jgi:hypothetical protein
MPFLSNIPDIYNFQILPDLITKIHGFCGEQIRYHFEYFVVITKTPAGVKMFL